MKTAFKSVSNVIGAAALIAVLAPFAVRAESLWPSTGANERGLLADRKAAATGDILTIIVSESAVASSSQSKKSTRESSVDDALTQFLSAATTRGLSKALGGLPAISATGQASYSGGGDVSNTQSLSARAAVLVSDVLPNGNLVIQGMRVVTFSGETQYVVLRGLVRPHDISPGNTVTSTNIADARVEFYSEGSLTDAQKRGWFSKLYEKLRPF